MGMCFMSMAPSAFLFDPRHIVLMGVSGCGKSTVGAALSAQIGQPYRDGDDLHPTCNVEKMRSGQALTDQDRWPWLDLCATALREAEGGLILGCSALRRVYRDRLRRSSGLSGLVFVHLTGPDAVLQARIGTRAGHYMPAALLQSQIATLEPPGADENAVIISIDQPVGAIVTEIIAALSTRTQTSKDPQKRTRQ